MSISNFLRLKNYDFDDPNLIEDLAPRILQFPDGLTFPGSSDAGPYLELSCFKYARSFVKNRELSLYKIFLPFPFQGVTYNFGANYDAFDALIGRNQNLSSVVEGVASTGGQAVGQGAADILSDAISKIPGVNIDADRIKKQASTVLGVTFNPRQELVFNGTMLRSYNFSYIFLPRNATESRAVLKIIEMLELSAYPDFKDATKVLLEYPDEFLLSFYDPEGSRLPGCPLIPDCFMSAFSYTINPMTGGRIFKDGSPTSYAINMTLSESNYLARPDLKMLRQNALPTD